jgi:hypothetical protein
MSSIALNEVMSMLPSAELEAAVKGFVEPIARRLPDERFRRNVGQAVVGILGSRSPVVCAMAQGSVEGSASLEGHGAPSPWAQAKRYYRLLDSDRFDHRAFYSGLYEIGQQILAEEGPDQVVIAIDPVNFEKPYAKKLDGVSVVRKSTPPDLTGEARLTSGYPAITATIVNTRVPVIAYADWFSYKTEDFYGEKHQILRALLASRTAFSGKKRRFIADSGLDDDAIFGWMDLFGETFVIRVKHTERIVEVPKAPLSGKEDWTRTPLEAVSRSVKFDASFRVAFSHAGKTRLASIQLGWASFRLPDTRQLLWLLVAREVSPTGEEIGRILLLTNVPIQDVADAQIVYGQWRLRSRIEHVYRFDQEQGVDVEDMRVRTLERMRRLFALVIVAVLVVFHLGETWPPQAILWLRRLGGKLGRSSDHDGPYVLLRGLAALIQTLGTLALLDHEPFPHDPFNSTKQPSPRSLSYG